MKGFRKDKTRIRILALALAFAFSFANMNIDIHAKDYENPENCIATVNEQGSFHLRFVNLEYEHNAFVSIRDLAFALTGTEKQFEVSVDKSLINITRGIPYVPRGTEGELWNEEELITWHTYVHKANPMRIDEKDVKYFTFLFDMGGYFDCFISPVDAAMIFDIDMEYQGNGYWNIDTRNGFSPDMADLSDENYFQNVHGIYIGDATTGETYFTYDSESEYAMASTTKLMTCLLTYEAVEEGRISMGDVITFSKKVDTLARGTDKVLPLYMGKTATVKDMIGGCLLPSSNEAALSLAEFIDGSEEAFVERMNCKAKELGMNHTLYYNCHGLPYYTESVYAVKMQNYTSAEDLYTLASYIVNHYPDMLSISKAKTLSLPSLSVTVSSTNYCLYNVPEMVGLKTGTTDQAGYCLVTASQVTMEDGIHNIVTVLLGANTLSERCRLSEMFARYGMDRLKHPEKYRPYGQKKIEEQPAGIPKKAGDLLRYCIKNLS